MTHHFSTDMNMTTAGAPAQDAANKHLAGLETDWRNEKDPLLRDEKRKLFQQEKTRLAVTTAATDGPAAPSTAVAAAQPAPTVPVVTAAVTSIHPTEASTQETAHIQTAAVVWRERLKQRNPLRWHTNDVVEFLLDSNISNLKEHQVKWLVYLRAEAWLNCGYLPRNPEELARLARAKRKHLFLKEIDAILPFFEVEGDCMYCPTLRKSYEESMAIKQKNSRAGHAGALARQANSMKPSSTTIQ